MKSHAISQKLRFHTSITWIGICLFGIFLFGACQTALPGLSPAPIGPTCVVQRYLEALSTGDIDSAKMYSIEEPPPLDPASKPCTVQVQRIVRENTRWHLGKESSVGEGLVLVEVVFEEPDVDRLLSGLVRKHLVEALRSKGVAAAEERLCEAISKELSGIPKKDILSLPRKRMVQCFTLKRLENQWKIISRAKSPCSAFSSTP